MAYWELPAGHRYFCEPLWFVAGPRAAQEDYGGRILLADHLEFHWCLRRFTVEVGFVLRCEGHARLGVGHAAIGLIQHSWKALQTWQKEDAGVCGHVILPTHGLLHGSNTGWRPCKAHRLGVWLYR